VEREAEIYFGPYHKRNKFRVKCVLNVLLDNLLLWVKIVFLYDTQIH